MKLVKLILCLLGTYFCYGQYSQIQPQEVYVSKTTKDTCIAFCGKETVQELYKLKLKAEYADTLECYYEERVKKFKKALVLSKQESKTLREAINEKKKEIINLNKDVETYKGITKKAAGSSFVLGVILTLLICF